MNGGLGGEPGEPSAGFADGRPIIVGPPKTIHVGPTPSIGGIS
jgi:hypothetical protein